ncbi:DUF1127 domain-containing protein [Microvirga pudoricolor]|uniref:DUF1127 domain-containing protein n=1 Tax=Microvirga pudoricolor TaxID=2778729 RepID=UPI001951BF8B|nr:DUF1127 domain-containing protein [Microvirga pudoricolor]MBM6595728.1 DUF1127 domain-containing protein [Microvirga pudoricolor]
MAVGFASENLGFEALSRRAGRQILFHYLLRVEAWFDDRAGTRALAALDDRSLADLGLSRADAARTSRSAPQR